MEDLAHTVVGKSREAVVRDIKQKLILGCDIDPWVAVIAKMNMYIHGDGKSNIRCANGLALASIPSFAPQRAKALADALDVVVANPPLGDIDFVAVAEDAARRQAETEGLQPTTEEIARRAAEWSKDNLQVIPHAIIEEVERDRAAKKAEEWREEVAEAKLVGDVTRLTKARKYVKEWDDKRAAAEQAIGAQNVHYRPAGRTAKGGALFLSSTVRCLKPIRDASLPVEWRGGVMGIIIDETVLNTREYASARQFLRQEFF